ncbi:MAG: right-handed parallel beta-helix repeat-containing protein [Thermoguttaceae bacterium]|nr:right-handed parallel beta-helix repeat-containing protein [Thermoguttaceae bacterium]
MQKLYPLFLALGAIVLAIPAFGAESPRFEPSVTEPLAVVAAAGPEQNAIVQKIPDFSIWLRPDGDDANPGTYEKPLRSFQKARDTVRQLRKDHPDARIVVALGAGTFHMTEPWVLTTEDSGTPENPVIWFSTWNYTTLSGGASIRGWKPVEDAAVLARLNESAKGRVWEADLAACGVTDFGDATTLGKRPELFCDGTPQTLARWPNDGFVKTGKMLGETKLTSWNGDGAKEGVFEYTEERISTWTQELDARLFGYFFWDWADDYGRIEKIDPTTKTISMRQPYHNYGYKPEQRFYGVNLLCELDMPSEWYLDRDSGKIYWIPPQGVQATTANTVLSVYAGEAMVQLNGASNIQWNNVRFVDGRCGAIQMIDCENVLISHCSFERFGSLAISILRGRRCGVYASNLRTLGAGGTHITGGDRKTLTPGLNYLVQTTVEDFGRLKRTYAPAVLMEGSGNRIAENLFRRSSSSAMRLEGNDFLIERNRIGEVVRESDDQGGIDIWYNPGYRGIVIRDNYFYDIVGGTHCGAAAIRLDDMISGVTMTGNVLERCGSVQFGGVQIHGGKENLVASNLFIDCFAVASFSRWGEKRWLEALDRPDMKQKMREAVDTLSPTWLARYPELSRIREDADINTVRGNFVWSGCESGMFLRDGGVEKLGDNLQLDAALFPDVRATSIPALEIDSKLPALGKYPTLESFFHTWIVQ